MKVSGTQVPNEWTFLAPVGLSQSASLLGGGQRGFSLKELVRVINLTLLASFLLRSAIRCVYNLPVRPYHHRPQLLLSVAEAVVDEDLVGFSQ